MKDNFYSYDISTIVSSACTVKASSKEEALEIIKRHLVDDFEEMMEHSTFTDNIEGPFDPSDDAVETLKEYPMCDITWRR